MNLSTNIYVTAISPIMYLINDIWTLKLQASLNYHYPTVQNPYFQINYLENIVIK